MDLQLQQIAESLQTLLGNTQSLKEGQQSLKEGQQSLIEGQQSLTEGQQSLTEAQQSLIEGQQSLTEGQQSLIEGQQLLTEGQQSLTGDVAAVLSSQNRLECTTANNTESLARIARVARRFRGHLPQRELKSGELRPGWAAAPTGEAAALPAVRLPAPGCPPCAACGQHMGCVWSCGSLSAPLVSLSPRASTTSRCGWHPPGGCAGDQLVDIVSSAAHKADINLMLDALLERDAGYAEVLTTLARKLQVSAAPPGSRRRWRGCFAMGPAAGHYTVPATAALPWANRPALQFQCAACLGAWV